MVFYKLTVDSF